MYDVRAEVKDTPNLETNHALDFVDREREGGQKSQNIADVLNGRPQNAAPKVLGGHSEIGSSATFYRVGVGLGYSLLPSSLRFISSAS